MSWCDGKNIWFLLRWFSWHNAYTEDTSIHASKGAHTVYASITIVILQFLHSSLFISFVSFCQLKVSLTAPFGVSHWQPMEHSFLVHFHRLCVSCENQNLNRRTNTLSAPDLRDALHVKDQHEECPICLGATRVLTDPKSCASCCQLWSSTRHICVESAGKNYCYMTGFPPLWGRRPSFVWGWWQGAFGWSPRW